MTRNQPRLLTIVIDASDIDKPSGPRTAVLDLFQTLFMRQPHWQYIVLVSQREPALEQFPYVHQVVIPFRNRLIERLWIQLAVTYFAVVKRADIVHFARTIGSIAWPAKSVLTVFDTTTLKHPELHSPFAVWFWRHIQPPLIRWTDQLIAISKNVADDLIREFHVPVEKIQVVYCAPKLVFERPVRPRSLEEVRQKYQLPNRYILFVGMLAKKKNLPTLILALNLLKRSRSEYLPLVIAGRRYRQSDDNAVFEQINSLELQSDVKCIGPVEDNELPSLYGGADVFVFPSLHEGFGIPCLEAMECGVPVIAARSGAIPEIVDDAALLLDDPKDEQTLAHAIREVLSNSKLRQELIAKGAARARQFSWPRFADQVLTIYQHLLEK